MFELIGAIPFIGGFISYLLPFLVLLTTVVFVHELGHYYVARRCGVASTVFSVGFGPELWGWTDRRGTRWRFSWIPLGGYVRFLGDDDPASATADGEATVQPGAFAGASLGRRAAIVAAGPIANFLFAILVLAAIALFAGIPSDRAAIGRVLQPERVEALGLRQGDTVLRVAGVEVDSYVELLSQIYRLDGQATLIEVLRDGQRVQVSGTYQPPTIIDGVRSGSAADDAGFLEGDRILQMDGVPVDSFAQIRDRIATGGESPLTFTVLREGVNLELVAQPRIEEQRDPFTLEIQMRPVLGIMQNPDNLFQPLREGAGLGEAIAYGFGKTTQVVTLSLAYVGQILVGATGADDLGGPILIAEFSGKAAQQGFLDFCFILALISASIGLLNLFPIPILDGGHLVLFAIEAVRGKPLGARVTGYVFRIGLVLLLALMVFVTVNDLARL